MLLAEILCATIGNVRHAAWSGFVQKGSWNRADSKAKSTTSAVGSDLWLVGMSVELDCLVAAVQTGEVTLAAVNTQVIVDEGEFLVLIHIVDVVDMLVSGSLDLLDCRNLANIHFSSFITSVQLIELISVFFLLFGLQDWWALSFPSVID